MVDLKYSNRNNHIQPANRDRNLEEIDLVIRLPVVGLLFGREI